MKLRTSATLLCSSLAALVVATAPVAASEPLVDPGAPFRAESPGGTCYKYTYPTNEACGALSGKSECKAEPTSDSWSDEKQERCKVEKGSECTCADDDDDEDDDD